MCVYIYSNARIVRRGMRAMGMLNHLNFIYRNFLNIRGKVTKLLYTIMFIYKTPTKNIYIVYRIAI